MSDSESLLRSLLSALGRINRALVEKAANLELEPDVSGALCELEHEAWLKAPPVVPDSGVAIEGYVEATVGEAPAMWLWKFRATQRNGSSRWEVRRWLEVSRTITTTKSCGSYLRCITEIPLTS